MSATLNYARRPFRDDRPAYVIAAFLALVGAVLLTINVRMAADYRRQVADTRAEIAQLEAREQKAEEKAQAARAALGSYKLSALAAESRGLAKIAAERKFSWTSLLTRLERTLPSDVGLAHLQPQFDQNGGTTLDMQLFARTREAIVRTIEALSKSEAFGHVELRQEAQPDAKGVDPIQFQLSCAYEPEGEQPRPRPAERSAAPREHAAPAPVKPQPVKPRAAPSTSAFKAARRASASIRRASPETEDEVSTLPPLWRRRLPLLAAAALFAAGNLAFFLYYRSGWQMRRESLEARREDLRHAAETKEDRGRQAHGAARPAERRLLRHRRVLRPPHRARAGDARGDRGRGARES
jgi:Tfp pilus assembly protein PilN